MVFIIPWCLGLVLAALHSWLRRATLDREGVLELFFRYQLALGLALSGLMGFLGHAFNPTQVAARIGWQAHPAFQFELAAFELGFGLAALGGLLTRNRGYWLGITLAPSVFLFLAGAQHAHEIVSKANMAPYNLLAILPDFLIPGTLLGLLAGLRGSRSRPAG